MKKLAFSNTDNLVYVAMSPAEFKVLAKTGQALVTDGGAVDIAWVKDMAAVFEGKRLLLQQVSVDAAKLATSINATI